jgi:hypothetical protein
LDSRNRDFTLLDNGQPVRIVTLQAFDGMDVRSDSSCRGHPGDDELNLPPVQVADAEHEAENFLRQHNGQLGQPAHFL